MSHTVTLIKLGGSVITEKTVPNSVKTEILQRLASEIREVMEKSEDRFVLAHGSGSFAHVPASLYKTKEGFINEQSRLGMAITQDSAAQLNRIIVSEFLRQKVPAVSVYASNSVVLNQGKVESYYDHVFREYMKHDLLPVISGDVLVDQEKGCGIWSADTILPFFAQKFQENGWKVKQLLHVTVTPGVYRDVTNPGKGIFPEISSANIDEVKAAMGEVKGFDVTGGMWAKIQECMALAKDHGIESRIISGEEPGAIEKVLLENAPLGTLIQA